MNIKQTAKNFFFVTGRNYSFLPLLWGVFSLIKNYKQKLFYRIGYIFSYILSALFLSFVIGERHYNLALIPFFVPMLAVLVKELYDSLSNVKWRKLAPVLFLCIAFSATMIKYIDDFIEKFNDHSGQELIRTGKMIDDNTRDGDKIIYLGIDARIYSFTKRETVSKYIFQNYEINHIPGARQEFLSDVLEKKPAVIALMKDDYEKKSLPDWYDPILNMIENKYRLLSDDNGYSLFIRNRY